MKPITFYELYCDRFGCAPEDFNRTVLWRCLYPHSRPLARLLWYVNRDYFGPDFDLIDLVKDVTSAAEMVAELNDFHYHHPPAGLFRRVLKIRISGDRLLHLTDQIFARPILS